MDGLWPTPTFDDWPITRIGALVFVIIVIFLVVIVTVIIHRLSRRSVGSYGDGVLLSVSAYRWWGWWRCGWDVVYNEGQDLVVEQQRCRCSSCGSEPRAITIAKKQVPIPLCCCGVLTSLSNASVMYSQNVFTKWIPRLFRFKLRLFYYPYYGAMPLKSIWCFAEKNASNLFFLVSIFKNDYVSYYFVSMTGLAPRLFGI